MYGTWLQAHQAAKNVQNSVVTLAIVFTCFHLRLFVWSVHPANPACLRFGLTLSESHCCSLLSCPGAWAVKSYLCL